MKKYIFALVISILSVSSSALADQLEDFANKYYQAWVETQKPGASKESLDDYLELLASDVGHQHLPYDPEATREPDNKERMQKGMSYYLGSHTKYSSTLESLTTGHNVIVIKYSTTSEGVHPQTKEIVKQDYNTVEVLEIENNLVSVIRKYSE